MPSISDIVSSHRPDLDKYIPLYKHFHTHPELSHLEMETAATVASKLDKLSSDFEIHTGIGGHGLAALLKNGNGQTVLLRADMDALPVKELTGLEYASKKTMKDTDGVEKPVMHACGHDMHITSLLAAAELLVSAREEWSGTLLLIFQPAEERGAGARRMVDEGKLYDKVPIPDIVLGAHVVPMRTGSLATKRGLMASSADSMKVTLHGRGGHASQPHVTVDPVVMAAATVMRLQTIVSREVDPQEGGVVTCGSIIAGEAENVLPDFATMKLDLRAFSPEGRKRMWDSVHRIVKAESMASNGTKDPEFEVTRDFPLTINDEDVTARLEQTFSEHFSVGEQGYSATAPNLGGSEDFSILATAVNKPYSFWIYGGVEPEKWEKAVKAGRVREDIPINHSALFAPEIMPTLQVGTDSYAAAALTWLAKK